MSKRGKQDEYEDDKIIVANERERGEEEREAGTERKPTTTTTITSIKVSEPPSRPGPISKIDSKLVMTTTTMTKEEEEEQDLTIKANRASDAFSDLVLSAIEKAKTKAVEKARELATQDKVSPSAIVAAKDSQDIATLGPMVADLARTFEDVMTEIGKEPYTEQAMLLKDYKNLLEEQISVINARIHFVKRLKK